MKQKDHWYPWYFLRWLTSRSRLTMTLAERGAYRDLLDYCYLDGSIPSEPKEIARLLGVTPAQIRKVWPVVSERFTDGDEPGRLVNRVAVDTLSRKRSTSNKRSEAGRRGGQKSSRAKAGLKPGLSIKNRTEQKQNPPPNPLPNGRGRTDLNEYPAWFESLCGEHVGAGGAIPKKQLAFQYAIELDAAALATSHAEWVPVWKSGRMVPDLHNWVKDWDQNAIIPQPKTDQKVNKWDSV